MADRVLTVSNAISALRVVLVVPIAFLLLSGDPGDRNAATWVILLAISTDFFDGYLARRLHQVSELGKVIDPLADKIAVGTIAVLLVLTNDIPVWYLVTVLARDAIIFAGGMYIRRKKGIIPQSNWPGKVAVTLIAAYMFACMVRQPSLGWLEDVLLWLSVLMMIVSTANYATRLFIGRRVASGV